MARVKRAILTGGTVAVMAIGFSWFNHYGQDASLYHFPVSNQVILLKEHESGKSFQWLRATEEHGIPFDYEMAIKLRGWDKGEREGAAVEYTKGEHVITLISTTNHLTILKEPLH